MNMNNEDKDTFGLYGVAGHEWMGADTLIDNDFYDIEGVVIGDIKQLMTDIRGGRVSYAALSFKTFLRMSEKLSAALWNTLNLRY
jgi:hypothetical protein